MWNESPNVSRLKTLVEKGDLTRIDSILTIAAEGCFVLSSREQMEALVVAVEALATLRGKPREPFKEWRVSLSSFQRVSSDIYEKAANAIGKVLECDFMEHSEESEIRDLQLRISAMMHGAPSN